jgi:isoleucyl-tRNA synthetase
MDGYDIAGALKPVLPFIDDASNWFVRRSRRRFWKSEDSADKEDAYTTLYYVLVRLSVILAPFVPFLSEELYRKLTNGESVHLLDWPSSGNVNELVVRDMERVREYVNTGLSLRAQNRLKVRQPLSSVTIPELGEHVNFEDILKDELNVKTVLTGSELAIDTDITPELKREGYAREVIRLVQSARKAAGLNVDDRIKLDVSAGSDELAAAIKEYENVIAAETLAVSLGSDGPYEYSDDSQKIEGISIQVTVERA